MKQLRAIAHRAFKTPTWSDVPRRADIDPDRYAQDMRLPAPERRYVMFFTPRSGSTMP